ncbi:hypothetical protein ACFX1Q_020943 [Malus domestica]
MNLARVLKAAATNIVPSPSACSPTRVVGVGPPPQFHLPRRLMASKAANAAAEPHIMASSSSYSDPCLDLFYNVRPPPPPAASAGHNSRTDTALINSLKQQLPVAWSHNPITSLKIIFNLSTGSHFYPEALSAATFWLHQNHPKTLARNFNSFEGLYTLVQILYSLLLPEG